MSHYNDTVYVRGDHPDAPVQAIMADAVISGARPDWLQHAIDEQRVVVMPHVVHLPDNDEGHRWGPFGYWLLFDGTNISVMHGPRFEEQFAPAPDAARSS